MKSTGDRRTSVLRRTCLEDGIDAEFTPDMSEFFRIGQAGVGHHGAQRRDASLGEEHHRRFASVIQTQQTPVEQTPRGRGYFGCPERGPPRQVLTWKPSATRGRVEKNMSSSRRM